MKSRPDRWTVRQAGRVANGARLHWEPLSEWGVEDPEHGFRAQLPTEQDLAVWVERVERSGDWRLYLCGEDPAPGHEDLDKADEFICRGSLLQCLLAAEDVNRRILRSERLQLPLFRQEADRG